MTKVEKQYTISKCIWQAFHHSGVDAALDTLDLLKEGMTPCNRQHWFNMLNGEKARMNKNLSIFDRMKGLVIK